MIADRPIPPAPCLTRPDWQYHPAASHEIDATLFRGRQHARLLQAQPQLRAVQEQQREAA